MPEHAQNLECLQEELTEYWIFSKLIAPVLMGPIKVCVGYEIDGRIIDSLPFDLNENDKPVYIEFKGWKTDLTKMANEIV